MFSEDKTFYLLSPTDPAAMLGSDATVVFAIVTAGFDR